MIKVVATFQLKPEEKDSAMPLFAELIELTRKESGCAGYDLAEADSDDNNLVILESWESQAVLDVHSASEHFTRIVPRLVDKCVVPPVITSYKQVI